MARKEYLDRKKHFTRATKGDRYFPLTIIISARMFDFNIRVRAGNFYFVIALFQMRRKISQRELPVESQIQIVKKGSNETGAIEP